MTKYLIKDLLKSTQEWDILTAGLTNQSVMWTQPDSGQGPGPCYKPSEPLKTSEDLYFTVFCKRVESAKLQKNTNIFFHFSHTEQK